MARILTYIKYELKIFLGNLSNVFWMIAFPLLLLTVFTIAFSNIRFREFDLEKASIAYDEKAFMSLYFVEPPKELPNIATLDRSSIENSIFKGQAMTKDQALEALKQGQIDAYVDKDLSLVINKNGINQMIMDEVLTTTKQIASLSLPLSAYDFNRHFVENRDEKYSPIDVVFYSLFAMITLYGAYLSGGIGNRLIVRGQTVALRNSTTPTSKTWQVMISVAASFLWSLFLIAIIMIYTEVILKQNFFSMDFNNIPLVLSALIFGIAWGLFLGTLIEKESLQTAAIISSLLILSGLSGLFSNDIPLLIQRSFPLIIKLNPVSLISNELIKVNMLGNYSTLNASVLQLLGYSIVLIAISIFQIRRKRA
ncbi:MAG: ABC transporter permease [Chloroflexi bacterium]|nr:ABC transporter permease [Chloroflexota bacterium]